jgi:hypothetical protein
VSDERAGWRFESLNLGELRAQRDMQFPEHWTPNPSFDEACRREVSLVFGAKGGGKSAFRRYISEIRKAKDLAVTSVDLQDFRYDPVADQVTALAKETGSDAIETLTRYWRNLLLLRCLEESVARVADNTRHHDAATGKALAVLGEHRERRADAGLLAMLGKAHQALRSIFVRDPGTLTDIRVRGLTSEEYDRVERASEDTELNDACVHIAGLLMVKQMMVCTVVDGIDRVADSVSKSALSIVLNSLVRAADRITLDASLADVFCVKILMPRELFTDVQGRDIDHLLAIQRDLDWYPEILLALITRRLSVASARIGGPQAVDFVQMLPSQDETWIHIVRHSMYRPRQLLLYLDAIRQMSAGQGITDAVVAKAIEVTSLKLSHAFIEEYRISMPSLALYLEAFAGQKAVTTLRSLEARLRAVFKRHSFSGSIVRAVSDLYFAGALGHVHELAPGSSDPSGCYKVVNGQRVPIACEFSYKPAARNTWLSGMPKDTVVALHPMLTRHASARMVEDHFIG